MKINPFRIDRTLKTYTYPIIKILLFIGEIILSINRGNFYHIENVILAFIEKIFFLCCGCASIFCIYISGAEITMVHENRTKAAIESRKKGIKCKKLPVEKMLLLAKDNDVVEIQIFSKGKVVEIGAASDIKPGSSKFFDKCYYIGNKEYKSLESFREALQPYIENDSLPVFSIDGGSPDQYK